METTVIATGPDDEKMRVGRWYKSDGSVVVAGERLCEVELEKSCVDLVADAGGVLKHLKREGEVIRMGEMVARIIPDTR